MLAAAWWVALVVPTSYQLSLNSVVVTPARDHTSEALPRAVALVGPTASGKSRFSIELAQRLEAPILCCDSVQVYRGLDIGSAKPSLADRNRVPHHLLDLVEPSDAFSSGEYARAALQHLSKCPGIFVGGTGFYLRAVHRTYSGTDRQNPQVDDPKRRAFEVHWEAREAEQPGATHCELQRVDPETAALVHPRNFVRALRTLWLCEQAGMPVSALRRLDPPRKRVELLLIVLDPGVEVVDRAIDRRCDEMIEAGFVAEVENLSRAGYDARHKAMRSLGYRQLLSHLAGDMSLAAAVDAIKSETRRYARRQRTYFRTQFSGVQALHIASPEACPWSDVQAFLRGGDSP